MTELIIIGAVACKLCICPSTPREHEIDPATIPSHVQVSLGVLALVPAQSEGFAYVKP